MKVMYEFCKQGDGEYNEDVFGYSNKYAWIIDGATDVFQRGFLAKKNEVEWYVNMLQDELKKKCAKSETSDLSTLLETTVVEIYNRINNKFDLSGAEDYMLPTFAVAFIYINECKMYYYILGDCSISFSHNDVLESLADERIRKFSMTNRVKLKEYIMKTKMDRAPLSLYQETRAKANTSYGYPIGMITGKGIRCGITGSVDLSVGDKVLIYSDGFLDYIRSDKTILEKLFDENKIDKVVSDMYIYLENMDEYKNSPRPKKIDDSTLLLLEVDQ